MLFNSLIFAVFFVAVLAVHLAPIPWILRKWSLLLASWLFYASWDPRLLWLLASLTVGNWLLGRWIERCRAGNRKLALGASIAANLGVLGFFKYAEFVSRNLQSLATALGWELKLTPWEVPLPIGISFFTFEAVAYLVDLYRGQSKASRSLLDFGLFLSFFPHLVAGPIIRPAHLLPQFETPRRATGAQFGWGMALVVLGLFEKIVLADQFLAPVAEQVFDARDGVAPGFLVAWCGTLAFAGQIFCDFAGYTTTAIGLACCLGFALPENFRRPYAAIGFSDFWRRWHISLSSWLRDYLYIPLGGSRQGPVRTQVNLMITMVLGGLWHGAAWTFVAWGALHGFLLILERWLRASPLARFEFWSRRAGQLVLMLATFVAICFTWVCFRARSVDDMQRVLGGMLGVPAGWTQNPLGDLNVLFTLVIMGGILGVQAWLRERSTEDLAKSTPPWLLRAVLACMIAALIISPASDRAFIYFQF